MNYYIGQKLFFVPRYGEKREITITKIGKKYIECDGLYGQKILIHDLSAINPRDNSCYYEGKAYLSKEDYDNEQKRIHDAYVLWTIIEKERYNLTSEQIEKIFEIIGVKNDKN